MGEGEGGALTQRHHHCRELLRSLGEHVTSLLQLVECVEEGAEVCFTQVGIRGSDVQERLQGRFATKQDTVQVCSGQSETEKSNCHKSRHSSDTLSAGQSAQRDSGK